MNHAEAVTHGSVILIPNASFLQLGLYSRHLIEKIKNQFLHVKYTAIQSANESL